MYYLIYLMLPLVYLFIKPKEINFPKEDILNCFYFSAKSNKPATLNLFNNDVLVTSWQMNAEGFKYYDFSGEINISEPLELRIENFSVSDTIALLSINVYQDNKLFSSGVTKAINEIVTNASIWQEDGVIFLTGFDTEKAVSLNLNKLLQRPNPINAILGIIFLAFLIPFILIIIISPSKHYFIFLCVLGVLLMLTLRSFNPQQNSVLEIKTKSDVGKIEVFYNYFPQFTHLKNEKASKQDNSFMCDVDFEKNTFIRIDFDEAQTLDNMSISASMGIFIKKWKPLLMNKNTLLINDLDFNDNTFMVKGNDPFITLSANFFQQRLQKLISYRENLFLFISLFVLILLLSLGFLLSPYIKLHFRLVYILYLTIPVLSYYVVHYNITKNEPKVKMKDYFYFSVKSSVPVNISLFAQNDSLMSWQQSSPAYRMLDCVYDINDSAGIVLKVFNLNAGDTVSFLSFNFYRNHKLFSLYDRSYPYCGVANANTSDEDGVFHLIARNAGTPVVINLAKTDSWDTINNENTFVFFIFALFILCFLLLLLFAPSSKYMFTLMVLSWTLLFVFNELGEDIHEQQTIATSTPQRSVETYYANTPLFNSGDKFQTKGYKNFFRTQIELGKHSFFRCDLDNINTALNDVKIGLKTGLLRYEADFLSFPKGKMIINDMDFNGTDFMIHGSDPFFAFTSTALAAPVKRLAYIRQWAFVFILLFFFALFVAMHKYTAKWPSSTFIITSFFLTVIASTLLFKAFNSDRIRLKAEKRNTQPFPVFKDKTLKDYTTQLQAYLNDQLTGRNKIILLNNYFYFSVFGQLINNPDIYFGKDGWMFYIGALGRELYENRVPFTESEMKITADLFIERRNWLKKRGAEFYIFFPRVAQFIYEDKLGKRMVRYHPKSKLDCLVDYLKTHTDLNIIDVATPIMEARKSIKTDLYHKNDSHWNYYGTYFAYDTIIRYIKRDFPEISSPIPLEEIKWLWTEDFKGDLADYAALTGYVKRQQFIPHHLSLFEIEPDFSNGEDNFERFSVNTKGENQPAMLMFRDSYAKYLVPYMGHHFSKSVYVWTYDFNKDMVLKHKPDIVLWQMSERFIYTFPIINKPFIEVDLMKPFHHSIAYQINNMQGLNFKDLWKICHLETKIN